MGRLRKPKSEKGIRTSSMLHPECRQAISHLQQEMNCSISDVIEMCVQFYLNSQHSSTRNKALIDSFLKQSYE